MRRLLDRILRSRRLRLFFALSLAAHLLVALAMVVSPQFRDVLLGRGKKVGSAEASSSDVQKAVETLTTLARKRLVAQHDELESIRAKLDRHQSASYERLKAKDAERIELVKTGKLPGYKPVCDVVPPGFAPLPSGDLGALSFVDLYARLPPLEERCGRLFERWHALAMGNHPTEPIPLSKALENARMKMPTRRAPNPAILDPSGITSSVDGKLAVYRTELNDLFLEAMDMVATAQRWLDQIEKREQDTKALFGQQIDVVPDPVAYFGHFLDPKLLKPVKLERLINPATALGAVLGRNGDVTTATEWMSIDRWYVVGPFTHPGESRRVEDLERKYPPEVGVDLDAVYEGKGGRKLAWKYRHIGPDFLEAGVRFEPYVVDNGPFAIWYFYTEIVSDEARQVLASFASDDYGVCWLNDRRVYQSPPTNQPWVPYTKQGFRVIDLKKGPNRLLFKLENGLGATAFSVILMTHTDRELIATFQKTQETAK